MMLKACLAGVLALTLNPLQAEPATTLNFPPDFFPPTTYTFNPYVEKISCDDGSGTGFKLQSGVWASANHVAGALHNCMIDNRPIKVTYADPEGDFALFDVPGDNRFGGLPINCQGFLDRAWYFGIGHGRGDPFPRSSPFAFPASTSSWLTMAGGFST